MAIVKVSDDNLKQWAGLCNELWPDNSRDAMIDEFNRGGHEHEYLYFAGDVAVAFLSLSIRNDYVEGKTDSYPVGYLEGIYVKPEHRKKGIAKELVQFAKKWASERGCTMLASDCELSNSESRAFHNKIGFEEASINVHFTLNLE